MLLNRIILLLFFLFVSKEEEPKKICDPSTPFKKNDQTCGSFFDICVKTDNEDCSYFRKACEQCPPTNYSVLMFIDVLNIKSQIYRSNFNLDGIKNQIKNSTSQLNGSLNNIEKKSSNQERIVVVCLIFILLNFLLIFGIYIFLKVFNLDKGRKNKKSGYDKKDLLLENKENERIQAIISENNIKLIQEIKEMKNKNDNLLINELKAMKNENDNVKLIQQIKEIKNENDERFQAIINENNVKLIQQIKEIKNENDKIYKAIMDEIVKSKLRFQIANQFDEIELFVSKFDNVIKLKKSIYERNMNINDYKSMIMKYKGVPLDNNQFLLSCIDSTNIPIFCEFDNNFDVSTMIVIKLKCDNIYPEMLQIWKHQKIKDLKTIISKLNTNHKDLLIFYKSKELDDDDKTIDDYKIEDNDWIKVVIKSEEEQNISMKSIFTAKERISIEFSKFETVQSIIDKSIQKIQDKMATIHFVVFLNNKLLENEKFIYEYNIDSKSLVEFCYFKNFGKIESKEEILDCAHIYLFKAIDKNTKKPVFLKAYTKSYMEKAHNDDLLIILREDLQMFQITRNHPRFIQLFDIYMDEKWIYIGLENLMERSMYKLLLSKNKNEIQTYEMSKWAHQMLEGLKHLHDHNFILKDMNPTNIWIDGNSDIKLPSFNMTDYLNHFNENNYEHKHSSFRYVAPEILENKPYEASADVWSLGVIMIDIVTHGQLFNENVQNIKDSHTIEYDKRNKPLDLINFIDFCVKGDPKKRSTIDQLMKHEFIEKYL